MQKVQALQKSIDILREKEANRPVYITDGYSKFIEDFKGNSQNNSTTSIDNMNPSIQDMRIEQSNFEERADGPK